MRCLLDALDYECYHIIPAGLAGAGWNPEEILHLPGNKPHTEILHMTPRQNKEYALNDQILFAISPMIASLRIWSSGTCCTKGTAFQIILA